VSEARDRLVLADVGSEAWGAFHAGGAPPVGRDVLVCWQRAQALGAPKQGAHREDKLLRGDALRLHAEHVELVQAIGDAVLDRATATVADRNFVLLLADADGVVIDTRGGGEFERSARDLRLIAGASWSERDRGTNAIGTAATANRPVEVHGHAHFGETYSDLVCYAAPIRGIDGAPIAVLDATSRLAGADSHVGRVITRAAFALEQLLRLQAYAAAGTSITRVLGRTIERMREPALLIESPGRVVRANPAAERVLGIAASGTPIEIALNMHWASLVAEALSPVTGGRPLTIGRGPEQRAWRMKVEPIAAPSGAIVAALVVFEPGHRPSRTLATDADVVSTELGDDVALRASDAHSSRYRSANNADAFSLIFAEDASVLSAIDWARRLATSDLPVMLLAETGAGKELFARAIHASSPRAAGPLLSINCGAVAESLLETELFGYAPGAFTGAERTGHNGLFHAARGGTLFLDEVAEMSPAMQAALLRVIETGTYRRVGDTRLERTDVRVLCATCRDLAALVADGRFRQDLYYRLKGATVTIPALRERTDVVALARHLLPTFEISDDAASAIACHPWPGNVRELKSTLVVAALRADGAAWVELEHLPAELCAPPPAPCGQLDAAERETLKRTLVECAGNLSVAAKQLGVARSTLYRMLKKHGLS
jgi:transcriptional regulator of acetoin/glycerol metabolism